MEIKHKEVGDNGLFYIEVDGEKLGEMTYRRRDEHHIIINHTKVDDRLAGKGAGKQMLTYAVEWARKNDVRIKPLCSFAASLFAKIKEFEDVLDK
jgi:uncharacterized protein